MPSPWQTVVLAASMTAPLACAAGSVFDDAGTTGSGGGAGTSTTTVTTTTTTTTGAASSSSGSCNLPDPAGKAYVGQVEIGLGPPDEQPVQAHVFYASGQFQAPFTVPPACSGTVMGSCCFRTEPDLVPGPSTTAGNVRLAKGKETLATLAMPSEYFYEATSLATPTLAWAPGDTLSVVASGGPVDAFSVSIVTPALLSSASLALSQPVSVSSDLSISWAPSAEACASVELALTSTGDGLGASIYCTVPDSAGMITVPSALLGKLLAAGWGDVYAALRRYEVAGALVGNAAITFMASNRVYGDVMLGP